MPGRSFSGTTQYRYGFNGQEKDNDIKGEANSYSAEFWEYDPRAGRRWNVDPIINPSESPFSVFGNNPIINIDPTGSTGVYHEVKKGDNLTKIAKKYGTTVSLLAKINNIKDPNKIQVGQLLTVGVQPSAEESEMENGKPEQDFKASPLTKYNNPVNGKFSYSVTATIKELATDFESDFASAVPSLQNTVIVGGPLLDEIKTLPSVQNLIRQGIMQFKTDGKFTPGEYFTSTYSIGDLTGQNARRIIGQSIKDVVSDKNLKNNTFFSAENWLGSYGFSMRVTGEGKVAIAIYDSKTVASATDRRETLQKFVPDLTATYQRYIWYLNVNDIKTGVK